MQLRQMRETVRSALLGFVYFIEKLPISVVGYLRAAGRRAQFDNLLHHTNGLEVRGNLSSGCI